MKNLLNSVKISAPGKSLFDLSHEVKMTGKMGNLYPCMYMETVPGDKVTLKPEALIRFAPLVSPVMHRFSLSIHYFFVPYRLLWDNWEDFIMGNATPTYPYLDITSGGQIDVLASCLGMPSTWAGGKQLNAIPWSAYQFVYNEYYRDQNLIAEVNYKLTNGDNTANSALRTLRKRAWQHDYFTAALPWAQKGSPVNIPVSVNGDAYVRANGLAQDPTITATPQNLNTSIGNSASIAGGYLYVNGGNFATNGTINDLRRAYALQEWLEKNARGGTRYVEWILNHFGFKTSDARLQRPEYITGIKQPIIISEVLNTTGAQGGLPQGNMSGHGVSYTDGNAGTFYSEEYGAVIGILSVMPESGYFQGIPKYFLRKTNLDYYQPSFDHIGEQALTNQEVYANHSVPNGVFGYLPRYCEYKYQNSRLANQMTTVYNYWTADRIFANEPSLNQAFVECDPSQVLRIFAVQNENDNLFMHIRNNVTALRPMSKYSTPI